MKVLKISAVAMVLALSAFSVNAEKMSREQCNTRCTEETGKTGSVDDLNACFTGCPGSEVGDVGVAAAAAHNCKDKENYGKEECQMALKLAGKWMLDIANDDNKYGKKLRKLIQKTDDADQ